MRRIDKIFHLLPRGNNDGNTVETVFSTPLENGVERTYTTLTPVALHDLMEDEQINSSAANDDKHTSSQNINTLVPPSSMEIAEVAMETDQCVDIVTSRTNILNYPLDTDLELISSHSADYNSDDSIKDKDYIVSSENESENSDLSEKNTGDTSMKTKKEVNETTSQNTKKRCRWNEARPSSWKRNRERKKRSGGQPYKSKTGKMQAAKIPKAVDCSKCRFRCQNNFSEEDRKLLCRTYWNLDFQRQKDFLLLNISSNKVKSRRPRKGEHSKQRNNAKTYTFLKQETKLQVCQNFFCKTLCISNIPINNAFKNKSVSGEYGGSDQRGQKIPSNKTPEEVIFRVKEHIESFPLTESHYTRKSTKRLYLDANLNITKMHDLFMEKCKELGKPGVSLITYRRIFCKEFNISFFKPKKDQCLTCSNYEKASVENKQALEKEYKMHLERKDASMKEKNLDKQKATNDKTFKSISCDMQSVLHIPTSQVSLLYYLRKLNLYNFTIYEAAPPNEGFCYFWTEVDGKRGSCEVGTCLMLYINSLPPEVTHLTIFSDTCGGQNRNIQIAALLLHAVRNHCSLKVIEQKFMESGHSYMEVDSMHSAIETAKHNIDIFSVHEYENVFKMARMGRKKKRAAYNTRELKYNEFLDLKKLVQNTVSNKKEDQNGKYVNWLKVKCFRYEKDLPNIIQYKYNCKDEYEKLDIGFARRFSNRRERENNTEELVIPQLYSRQLPISAAKKKDLLQLCVKNIIPQALHPWYESLPASSAVHDATTEPAEDDSDEGEQF